MIVTMMFSQFSGSMTEQPAVPSEGVLYVEHAPVQIVDDDDFLDYSFQGNGTVSNPYLVSGLNITTGDTHAITIQSTTKHFRISGCYLDASSIGVYIDNVADGTAHIEDNQIVGGHQAGIYVDRANLTTIKDNALSNEGAGIRLANGRSAVIQGNTILNDAAGGVGIYFLCCNDSIVSGNHIKNGTKYNGIFGHNSSHSLILSNEVENVKHHGIVLFDSVDCEVESNIVSNCEETSIFLSRSHDSVVNDNTASNNGIYGLFLYYNEGLYVSENTVYYCTQYCALVEHTNSSTLTLNLFQASGCEGMVITALSRLNTIHHNAFSDNCYLEADAHARDDGSANTWFDANTHEGNYWQDWSGTGSYTISGTAGAVDSYPLGTAPVDLRTVTLPTSSTTISDDTSTAEDGYLPQSVLWCIIAVSVSVLSNKKRRQTRREENVN